MLPSAMTSMRDHHFSNLLFRSANSGDLVYLTQFGSPKKLGPYVIASVPSAKMYTLALEDGEAINNGQQVEEKNLMEA